jgi:phenylalanyl-tRNA synthetase alpha chain
MASLKSLMAFDKLEAHMTTVAYIEGFIPTKKDISLFKAISEPGEKYPNASRWYNHIATFNKTRIASLPGVIEELSAPPAAATAVAPPPPPAAKEPKPEKQEKEPKPEKEKPPPKEKASKEPKAEMPPPPPPSAPAAPAPKEPKAAAMPVKAAPAKAAATSAGGTDKMEDALKAALEKDGVIADSLAFAEQHVFDHAALIGVCKSLSSAQNIATENLSRTVVQLSEEGLQCAQHGSPEVRVFALVPAGDGILETELMAAAGAAGKVGMAKAVQNKWLEVLKEDAPADAAPAAEGAKKPPAIKRVKRAVPSVTDSVQAQLKVVVDARGAESALPAEELALLKKRNLLAVVTLKSVKVTPGPTFETWGQKALADLTHEMLVKGTWRGAVFKPLNLDAAGKPPTGGALHPILKVKTLFREIFLQLGFEEMQTNKYVESSFWNFDALYQPQQHPARDMQDTFFVSTPSETLKIPPDYLARVKATHENGGAQLGEEFNSNSTGWQYDWSEEVTRQNLLRTHTTAVSSRTLYKLAQHFRKTGVPVTPQKYFSIDRVFRNEALDATHLAEFHQVEGFVIGENLSLGHLMGTIADFYKRLGPEFAEMKFKPTYNPYTEPSMEFCCWHPTLNKWVEVGNSGVFRPEMLKPMGFPDGLSVIAWGLALERPTMIKYKFKDIRALFGHRIDLNMTRAHPIVRWT